MGSTRSVNGTIQALVKEFRKAIKASIGSSGTIENDRKRNLKL